MAFFSHPIPQRWCGLYSGTSGRRQVQPLGVEIETWLRILSPPSFTGHFLFTSASGLNDFDSGPTILGRPPRCPPEHKRYLKPEPAPALPCTPPQFRDALPFPDPTERRLPPNALPSSRFDAGFRSIPVSFPTHRRISIWTKRGKFPSPCSTC